MLNKRILSFFVIIILLMEIIFPAVNSVVLATQKNTMKLNYTKYIIENLNTDFQLEATFTGDTEKITWKSDNENAVIVDQNGKVTPKSAGFSYIRAKGTTCSEECMVYVATPVLLSDGTYGYVGDLDRNGVLDANDASLIGEIYKTEEGNKEIADIDGNGVIDINDSSLLMEIYKFYEFTVPATEPTNQNNDKENEQENQAEDPTNPTEKPQEITYTNDLKETDLIRIYNSKTGFDFKINKDTTINEVIAKYGQPKIKTESAFGGYAYTFYTDNKYSNYLYIETTANDGTIMSYGTIWNEFFIYGCGYDEKISIHDNTPLKGFDITNGTDLNLKGGLYYNGHKLIEGSYEKTREVFEKNYKKNPSLYLKSMAKHATTMYNAICSLNGYTCNLQFNEDIFYINEQLKQNDSSIIKYAEDMGKTPYLNGIGVKENVKVSDKYYTLSPIMMVDMYYNKPLNKKNMPERYKYSVFDYNLEQECLYEYCITQDMFKIWDKVALTSEETTKLNEARNYYKTAMDLFNNNTGSIYKNEPIDNPAESLYAGELKDTMKNAGIAWYNATRAGQGLSPVTYHSDAYKKAQAKSVLMSYRWNNLRLDISHTPDRPKGVTDEYWKSVIAGVPASENIDRASVETGPYAIIKHINQFLDDSGETPFNIGHRTSLLTPTNSAIGYGVSDQIGVIEVVHSTSPTKKAEIVAWPANGVTLLETLSNKSFRWSAQFKSKYTVTTSTTVSVKCLQTGETWFWDKNIDNGTNYFRRDTTLKEDLNNRVIFANSTLIPQPGFVYEITIGNLTDKDTGTTTSYKYRSILEYGDTSKYSATSTNISIDIKNLSSVSGENKTYYIPIGEQVDLDATLDKNLIDKKLTWSTSNNNITLTQNGTVYLDKKVNEKIAITVTHDSTKATDTIYLRTFDPNQVKFSESNIDIIKNETKSLSISELGTEIGGVNSIDWYVIKDSNSSIEYSYNDSEVKKYMEITKVNDRNITIKAINASVGDNTFKIIAKVNGKSGTYKGETNISITIPLERIRFSNANKKNTGLSIYSTPGNPHTMTINMEDFYELNQTNIIRYKVSYAPSNTTVSTDVTWELLSKNGVLTSCDEIGSFKMNKPGTASIKITSIANPELTAQLDVTITSSTMPTYKKGDVNGDGKVTLIDYGLVLAHVKRTKLLTGEELQRADVNEDKKVTLIDYGLILAHVKRTKLLF